MLKLLARCRYKTPITTIVFEVSLISTNKFSELFESNSKSCLLILIKVEGNQECGRMGNVEGTWKRKLEEAEVVKRLIFCGSGSTFSKSDASGYSKLATTIGVKCNNNNIISRYITMFAKFPF